MKLQNYILFLTIFIIGCSTNNDRHGYIKVLSIIKADSVNDYNKGFTLGDYFFYDLVTDSLTLRVVQKRNPFEFATYKGKLRNGLYIDTLLKLFASLKTYDSTLSKTKKHCYQPTCYCNGYYLAYSDGINSKFLSSHEINNDNLISFIEFCYRLKDLPLEIKLISDNEIDKTEEIVKTLKGLGVYDSVVKRYVPLPCKQGIEMEYLYGKWRTIGDENNDPTLNYWTNIIDKNGSWIMEQYMNGKATPKYSGRIISVTKNNIKVKSKDGIAILQILNLTENCLEYKVGPRHIWRLDRVK